MLAAAAGEAQEVCSRMGTELTCLQGEVNPAVRQMIVVADAAGAADSRGFTGIMSPGQEILLCGYTGLEGKAAYSGRSRGGAGGKICPFVSRTGQSTSE